MEDLQIIELYFKRDEAAITETASKYGAFCHGIAFNVLSNHADAEECVNDTYLQAWNSIPPLRPDKFGSWLGRVIRNIAINLWNKNHRQKRYAGIEQVLNELEECIPGPQTVEHIMEEKELAKAIDMWLTSLPQDDRVLFMRRYWYGESVKQLAKKCGVTPGKLAKRMFKLRQSLKSTLEREGCFL